MINTWENNDVFRGLFSAKATVTNIRKRGKNGSLYLPVYEYYAEGQQRKVRSKFSSNDIVAKDGSEVDVYFYGNSGCVRSYEIIFLSGGKQGYI